MQQVTSVLINWPLFIYVIGIALICTVAFNFVQLRYFIYACKQILFAKSEKTSSGDMTPMQAFINTLSTNLGNGAIAGVATAIHFGGPGAAIWLLFFGFVMMAVRFAEVFLSMHYGAQVAAAKTVLGGPMLYLKQVAGGHYLAYIYAVACFLFGLMGGNAIQTNSMRISLETTFGFSPVVCAVLLLAFIVFIIAGGAERVIAASDRIVPVKVLVFFSTTLVILGYHYANLLPAFKLMLNSAFYPTAAIGAVLGYTVQQALRYGMMRSIFATESGLGTAAILFGFTGSKKAVQDGITAMLSTFISTLVCFIVALCIVASGAWTSGLKSTDLTIAAFSSVFGWFGASAVTFLSVTFGIGVIVSFIYITRQCWLYLTGGRFETVFSVLYCAFAFGGALMTVEMVWSIADIVFAIMLFVNLFGILYLIPVIKKELNAFAKNN